MKTYKYIVPVLLFFITSSSFSQDYFYTSLSQAKKIAKEENKWLFVDFSAVWCGPCKMMSSTIFPDPEVKSALTEKYVCVELMLGQNKGLFGIYNVKSFPTFIVMKSTGKEVYRWTGASVKEGFLHQLTLIPEQNDLVEKYDSLYSKKKKDITFLREYFDILTRNNYLDKAEKIAKKILKYDKDWFKKENMNLILNYIYIDKYYKFTLANKQQFCDSMSIDVVERHIFDRYLNKHIYSDTKNEIIDIKKIKKEFKKILSSKNLDFYLNQYLFIVLKNKNDNRLKKTYIVAALKYLQLAKKIFTSDIFYSQINTLIFKIKTVSEFLQMQKAFEFQFGESPEDIYLPYFDLKAFVEYHLGEKEKAYKTIQKANELSVKKTGKPFKTDLKNLVELYKVLKL